MKPHSRRNIGEITFNKERELIRSQDICTPHESLSPTMDMGYFCGLELIDLPVNSAKE